MPAQLGEASYGAAPRLRVLMLPPIIWLAARKRHRADAEPDLSVLERSLKPLGIDVVILDPMSWPWNPMRGRHPLLQGIDPLRALRVLLFHRDADAVICVFEGPALLPALLRGVLRFRPPVFMWDVGLVSGWRLRDRIVDIVIPRVDGIFVLASNQKASIAARWPSHAPVRCVGHYIDTVFWRPTLPGTDQGYVLSVGDDAGRDHATLLAAAARLGCAMVIRSGHALALDPEKHRSVRQLREKLSFAALRDLYAGASLVVVPLHDRPHAGGVSAFLEAAAMGRAIVVSGSAGIMEWVRHEETCLVVQPGDAEGLAGAIGRLLADHALRANLGQAARSFVEQSCTPEAFSRRLACALRVQASGLVESTTSLEL